jgi:hypothetical protein
MSAFIYGDGLLRATEPVGLPSPDLDEYDSLSIFSDQINLAERTAEIPVDDLDSATREVFGGGVLALFSSKKTANHHVTNSLHIGYNFIHPEKHEDAKGPGPPDLYDPNALRASASNRLALYYAPRGAIPKQNELFHHLI